MVYSFALALSAALNPHEAKFKIVAASLFKNGYAVVTRSLDVSAGTTIVSDIPSGAMGTVWFQTTDGLKITGIKNTFAPDTSSKTRPVSSILELLALNLNRTVKLSLEESSISGKLISATPELVLIQTKEGIKGIPPSQVVGVLGGAGLKQKTRDVTSTKKRVLKISVKGDHPGKVYMMALEHGLSWAPAYSLDITNPEALKFTMKATLIDDLGDIKGIETRLVTGFPNMMYTGTEDPIFAQTSLDQYLASIGANDAKRDALQNNMMLSNSMMGQATVRRFRAGMGGGAGFPAEAAAPQDMAPADGQPAGVQTEDLYFYRLQDVHLDLGDRAYYVLAAGKLPFKEVYTWEGNDPVVSNPNFGMPGPRPQPQDDQPIPVWHSLEFDNKLGLPLTTAPAVTVEGGEILGQDILKYTSKGAKGSVRITKALDVEADSYDEELSREQDKLKYSNHWAYDLLHLQTTMGFVNHKSKTIHLHITFPYTGNVEDAGGGTPVKEHKGLHDVNPAGRLAWDKDLGPGETLTISFKTGVYVNQHGW